MTPAEHIEALARQHGIEVVPHSRCGRAWKRAKRVAIRPVKSDVTYAVALHEFGHVLTPQRGSRLDREVEAWEWAEANALHWTPRMEDVRRSALHTYLLWAKRRQRNDRAGRVFITADHPIYRYLPGAQR